jgi:hypothetical protein
MSKKSENRDGEERYKRIMELLDLLKTQIAATDRKVTALEKAEDRATARIAAALERAERAKKAEAADVTMSNNEAAVAEGAGARNGRERNNNQKKTEQAPARAARAPPRGPGPGPAELAGEGWLDSKTRERGRWPKLVDTKQRLRALRGGGTIEREWKIYEFPVGTERGQFQLWIDGNYVKNVTDEMLKAKGDLMALYGRDDMDEFDEWEH